MNIEEVYTKVNATKEPAAARQVIIDYLMSCVDKLENSPNLRKPTAHDIVGLMSTEYGRSLKEADPLDITLTFAAELELVEDDDEDWPLLVEVIKSLE
jgi:hypothetical protein